MVHAAEELNFSDCQTDCCTSCKTALNISSNKHRDGEREDEDLERHVEMVSGSRSVWETKHESQQKPVEKHLQGQKRVRDWRKRGETGSPAEEESAASSAGK